MVESEKIVKTKASSMKPLFTPLQRFSHWGGLSLLALYLPVIYSETTARKSELPISEKDKSPPLPDWVKLESTDDIYEDLEDPSAEPVSKQVPIMSMPQHSLTAFGLFLRLPAYSEVLLQDKLRAQCLLRLVLGVSGDGDGSKYFKNYQQLSI